MRKKANYGSVQKANRNSTPHLNLKELHIACLIFSGKNLR